MKDKTGWIMLHRKILENPISSKPTWAWLWVVLLLKANHEEKKIIWNNSTITVKEGQFITGRDKLSKETGINSSSIERILKYLENEHQIEQQKTTKYRLITILNWKSYQEKNIKSNNRRTTDEQQMNTNNNDNNEKNDNKNTNTLPFLSFWSIYPKKINKTKCEELWKRIPIETQTIILEDIPKRRSDDKWIGGFIKDPERYIKNRQWEDEIISKNSSITKEIKTIDFTK